jgi:predicted RNA polymerase sigma factor
MVENPGDHVDPLDDALDRRVATLWRVESPRLIARLMRLIGDLDAAEEIAQDVFVAALEKWRRDGVPENPAAWLTTTGRYLAVDRIRRRDTQRGKYRLVAASTPVALEHDLDEIVDADLADDLLGLIFMACHPMLSPDGRSALTLKLVCGLGTDDIARAFLTRPATIAQRIVRAKRTLAAAKVRFELPTGSERTARLDAVREVIYLVFNEGYTPTSGERWIGSELCAEALRLGRMLAALTPTDTETLGLLALIELQASRLRARTGPQGEPILLEDQDRSRWDRLLVQRGLAALDRIEQLGGTTGPYALQAAIAACHAMASRAQDTDWKRITALYDGLARVTPSPVIELNRAVATGRAYGAEAGLAVLQPLLADPQLRAYHLLPAVAGDLLCRAGDHERARESFLQAAAMTGNGAERTTMQTRAAACAGGHRSE